MPRIRCDGCSGDFPEAVLTLVRLVYHTGETDHALYCPECIALAEADFNGETASITLTTGEE